MKKIISVIIRTLNEGKYLPELLQAINCQETDSFDVEIVVIDSGSEDNTLKIAQEHKAKVTHIRKSEFSFGRSLNVGCEFSSGDFLVFISGHCVPTSNKWLYNLVKPISDGLCDYTYGRQLARDTTKFSEHQLFEKYFPNNSSIPQKGFFCNNANSAISRPIWSNYLFDEELTGCEDMELAKRLLNKGGEIGYVAEAAVYHIHNESWAGVQRRYEREAIALQKILPEIHLSIFDVINYFTQGVIKDFKAALYKSCFVEEFFGIIRFRFAQYHGAYRGNHNTRRLSQELKQKYFYPRWTDMDINNDE